MIVTPLAKRAALRTGVISVPRSRDIHVAPVPLLGGAAIYAAFVLALLFVGDRTYIRELVGILLGATLISLFGLVDDRWGLSPAIKMGGQVLAGIVLLVGGVQVNLFDQGWLNWGLTLFWVVGITNALNFLDNMDGLSGGVATIAAAFFLLLAAMNEPTQILVAAMAAALIGACAGFLRYNWNPANIFMGDTGSLFLGFILAALAIKLRFPFNTYVVTWMVPVMVLLVPIFDTTLVVVSRLRRRVNPFTTPGKDHISHRLVALGMNKREAVLTVYLLCGVVGMVGTFLTRANLQTALFTLGGVAMLMIAAIAYLEYICPGGQAKSQPLKID
ncbi:MAG: undecaprenyl/decaprenyl-phosphate alpha-N-acetylglucosaminyl 1-phosphate transferase [Chloroflexaceae bacterium]|nr:undecaprenyl/decaprenyl-phosphate alpha-N-acetylglucosaminyl 1-phosphate transferase [Chloroflexaceae bacterium]NJO06643.1 undecaprenyl/decaprenyl-phosphate alpha-N-acetylglucosaminyl 1-phosphate transferase [Chloroflexaceae bacterium]